MPTAYVNYKPVEVDAVLRLLPDLPLNQPLALDTETSGLYVDGDYDAAPPARVSVVSLAWRGLFGEIHTLALPFDQGRVCGKPGKWSPTADDYEFIGESEECAYGEYCEHTPWNFTRVDWQFLTSWLTGRRIVMQHMKFDKHIMRAGLRKFDWTGVDLDQWVVWDTMLTSGIIWPLQSSSLDNTARHLFSEGKGGTPELDAALKKNGVGLTKRYDLVPLAAIGVYAGKDAELTLRIAEHQWRLIEEGAVDASDVNIIEVEHRLSRLLYKMEQRGVGFDAEGMRAEADKMRIEIARIEAELPFKPPNVNAAKRWFFDELGVVPIKVTPGGKPSLDAEVVARLAADNVKGAREYAHLANMQSALSKWYVSWPYKTGPDGRIRTNFRQGRIESDRKGMTSGGAVSGRLSAERVQLQGVPQDWRIPEGIKGVKKLFTARPGFQLWQFDLSNAEVRVAAWVSRCKSLANRINSGENIHDANTRAIFEITEDDPRWKQYRVSAKRGIFGRMYGAGIRTLKSQIDNDLKTSVPESQIQAFMDALDSAYPELKATAKRAERKVNRYMGGCGYVRLAGGRKRVFGPAEHTYKAFNAVIQGSVAEVMKLWMLALEEDYPGWLVNQVHDAVWMELPDDDVETLVQVIKSSGERLYEMFFSTEEIPIQFTVDAERLA